MEDKETTVHRSVRGTGCPVCRSTTVDIVESQVYCRNCGSHRGDEEFETGFHSPSFDPDRLRDRSTGTRSTGSTIKFGFNRKFDRLSKLQKQNSKQDVAFLQEIIRHVVDACGTSKTASSAVELLDQVDSAKSFGARRAKMKGSLGMSPADSRGYRAMLYAAASIDIINVEGSPNRSRQIARDWGLNYSDFTGAKRFINSQRRAIACEPPVTVPRRSIISQELSNNTEHLSQLVGWETANKVRKTAVRILEAQLELLEDVQEIGVGRFTNHTPRKAALFATVEAMAQLNLDSSLARRLFALNPVPGCSNYILRSAQLFRRN